MENTIKVLAVKIKFYLERKKQKFEEIWKQ